MIVSEMKIGSEFLMDGLSYPDNTHVRVKCKLVEIDSRGRYIVDTDNCLIFVEGADVTYPIKNK